MYSNEIFRRKNSVTEMSLAFLMLFFDLSKVGGKSFILETAGRQKTIYYAKNFI